MYTESDVRYAAGIVDGEGCFQVGKTFDKRWNYEHYSVMLQVKMTDERVPAWLKTTFGGRVHFHPREGANENQYAWDLREREKLQQLTKDLMPYLITKKLPALIVLEFCARFPKGFRRTEEALGTMQIYYEAMRVANSRGPGSEKRKAEFLKLVIG